jgi:hypothetical protein
MDHILEPNSEFDFSQISIISPTSLSGGNYFLRMLTKKQEPLYIQPPKCFTKQGIIHFGKKIYCDLIFKHEDESFLEFMESLERFCHKQIYENREKWFEPGLTMMDIENCFVCPTKSYKSGKLQILRSNIPVRLGECDLKIFNEQEQDVPLETVKENTSVMTIVEIQGIRCSARSFQLDLEIKQMMILQPKDLFQKCLFGKPLAKESKKQTIEVIEEPIIEKPPINMPVDKEEENEEEDTIENTVEIDNSSPIKEESLENNDSDLCEITLDIPDSDDTEIKLKNPNDVYYEMYKEAKRKAQIARDLAIASYLSAKQIKHNYLTDEVFSDDEEMMRDEKEMKELNLENVK